MTAVQLVLDAPLLRDIDRQARKLALSRSEFVRQSMREAVTRLEYLEAVEAERRAYERKPLNVSERAALRGHGKAASSAVVADGDDW
jgi:metal-responsive CopG/Arc/MetJ family transcriptional regulator